MIWGQLRGMLWYELLMHWRRGWLKIVIVAFAGAPVLITLLLRELVAQTPGAQIVSTSYLAVYTTTFLWPLIIAVIPILTADTIPVDRMYNIRDVLDALPVTRTTYLLGKLFSVWAGIAIAMLTGSLVCLAAINALIAPFDTRLWFVVWFGGMGYLALLFAAVSVFMCAGRPNRRQAIALSFALTVLYGYGFVTSSLFTFYRTLFGNINGAADILPPILTMNDLWVGLAVFGLALFMGWGALYTEFQQA